MTFNPDTWDCWEKGDFFFLPTWENINLWLVGVEHLENVTSMRTRIWCVFFLTMSPAPRTFASLWVCN